MGTPLSASALKTSRWCGSQRAADRGDDRAQQIGVLDGLLRACAAVGEMAPALVLERDLAALPRAPAGLDARLQQHELVRPGGEAALRRGMCRAWPASPSSRRLWPDGRGRQGHRATAARAPRGGGEARGTRRASSSACNSASAASRTGPDWRSASSSGSLRLAARGVTQFIPDRGYARAQREAGDHDGHIRALASGRRRFLPPGARHLQASTGTNPST